MMPSAKMLEVKMIPMELVKVAPMSAPTSTLMYFDYIMEPVRHKELMPELFKVFTRPFYL